MKNYILDIKNYKNILAMIAVGSIIIFGLLSVFPGFVDAIIVEQVRKSVDESTTSQTLQDDDELRLPLQKNQTYIIDGAVFINTIENGANCGISFTFPEDATVSIGFNGAASSETGVVTISGVEQPNCGSVVNNTILISGTIVMGSTDGNLQLQWNSVTSTTTVKMGSFLRADRM